MQPEDEQDIRLIISSWIEEEILVVGEVLSPNETAKRSHNILIEVVVVRNIYTVLRLIDNVTTYMGYLLGKCYCEKSIYEVNEPFWICER